MYITAWFSTWRIHIICQPRQTSLRVVPFSARERIFASHTNSRVFGSVISDKHALWTIFGDCRHIQTRTWRFCECHPQPDKVDFIQFYSIATTIFYQYFLELVFVKLYAFVCIICRSGKYGYILKIAMLLIFDIIRHVTLSSFDPIFYQL